MITNYQELPIREEMKKAIAEMGFTEMTEIQQKAIPELLAGKEVIAKAQSHVHRKVLEKIGADRVVFPEHEMGVKLAQGLSSSNVLNFIELSDDYGIVELAAPRSWVGHTLKELDVRAKYGVNIIAIRDGASRRLEVAPGADYALRSGDVVVTLGRNEDINRLHDL